MRSEHLEEILHHGGALFLKDAALVFDLMVMSVADIEDVIA